MKNLVTVKKPYHLFHIREIDQFLRSLKGLEREYGWKPIKENNSIIGLSKNGANVSLEPGGALELSGAQLQTVFQTCDEVNEHLLEVKSIADKLNIGFIGLGAAPHWKHDEMPIMPKGRYKLMSEYMDKVGTMGKSMMFRTCTVQVNLDFSSELRHGAENARCFSATAYRNGTFFQFTLL